MKTFTITPCVSNPHHIKTSVTTKQGGTMLLTVAVYSSTEFDIWGQLNGKGTIRLPKNINKDIISQYGGINEYLNSQDRGLLYHLQIGTITSFIAFAVQLMQREKMHL